MSDLKEALILLAKRQNVMVPSTTDEHLIKRMGFSADKVAQAIKKDWLVSMGMPGFFEINVSRCLNVPTYKPGQSVKVGTHKGKVILDTGFFVKVKLSNGVTQMAKKENVK